MASYIDDEDSWSEGTLEIAIDEEQERAEEAERNKVQAENCTYWHDLELCQTPSHVPVKYTGQLDTHTSLVTQVLEIEERDRQNDAGKTWIQMMREALEKPPARGGTSSSTVENSIRGHGDVACKSWIDMMQETLNKPAVTPTGRVTVGGSSEEQLNSATVAQGTGDETLNTACEECAPDTEGGPQEYFWTDMVEQLKIKKAPHKAFSHVDAGNKSFWKSGHVVEMTPQMPEDCTTPVSYWPAEVQVVSGMLIQLRWVGSAKHGRGTSFSLVLPQKTIHPLGWAQRNGVPLREPKAVVMKSNARNIVEKVLKTKRSPPAWWFDKPLGMFPTDFLCEGTVLELQDLSNPTSVWFVYVITNVGGRLRLRYAGCNHDKDDVWLYFLYPLLHAVSWGRDVGLQYIPPKNVMVHSNEEREVLIQETFDKGMKCVVPKELFVGQEMINVHQMRLGLKLEVLHPQLCNTICPGTISKILNNYFFVVKVDSCITDGQPNPTIVCHKGSRNIFPARWSVRRGLRLRSPKGWKRKGEFEWKEYLQETGGDVAPERCFDTSQLKVPFQRGMKLEAVHPTDPAELCAATVIKVVGHLLWLHLDVDGVTVGRYITPFDSLDLYPAGWSFMHRLPLKLPVKPAALRKPLGNTNRLEDMSGEQYRLTLYKQVQHQEGFCTVFFNRHCFSGPFLHKSKVCALATSFGPGPVRYVLKDAMTKLIKTGYKPSRVLTELQPEKRPSASTPTIVLKANLGVLNRKSCGSLAVEVPICRTPDQLEEYCRFVCVKLDCCPYLMSTKFFQSRCPENCQYFTKTQNGQYLRFQRVGGNFITDAQSGKRPVGRPRKKKRGRKSMKLMNLDEGSEGSANQDDYDQDQDQGSPKSKKRKYDRKRLPPTEIKTRGVKLPSYSTAIYERRCRRQIEESLQESPVEAVPQFLPPPPPPVENAEAPPVRRKRGRPRRNPLPVIQEERTVVPPPVEAPTVQEKPTLTIQGIPIKNCPSKWTAEEVANYLRQTNCAMFASWFVEEEIDGTAFLLLNLETVLCYCTKKLGPALKLCEHVCLLKTAYIHYFSKLSTQ